MFLVSCGGGGGSGNNTSSSSPPETFKIFGLDFGPYLEGQDPTINPNITETQLLARMEIIQTFTQWIRTYGSTAGLENSGSLARNLGLKVAVSAWIDRDLNDNEREVANLITTAQAGEADLLIVGSEVLLRRDIPEDDLIAYINRVKQETSGIPVTYADRYEIILAHPRIIDAVDIVFVNYYPYWDGVPIDLAVAAVHGWHQQVLLAADGKPVIVSETGWPSDGLQIGNAIPSPENASFYFINFIFLGSC